MKNPARSWLFGLAVSGTTLAVSLAAAVISSPGETLRLLEPSLLSAGWSLLLIGSWLGLESFGRIDPLGVAGASLRWGARALVTLPAVVIGTTVTVAGVLLRVFWIDVASVQGLRSLLALVALIAGTLLLLAILRPQVAGSNLPKIQWRGLSAANDRGLLAFASLALWALVLGPLTVGQTWRTGMLWNLAFWIAALLPATFLAGLLVRGDVDGLDARAAAGHLGRSVGPIAALAARLTWLEWLVRVWGGLLSAPLYGEQTLHLADAIFSLRDPWTLQWLPWLVVVFWGGAFALGRFAWLLRSG